MPAKHVVANKNPLHPSALRVGDLTIGRRIVRFNAILGILGEFTVVKKPHVGYFLPGPRRYEGQQKSLIVTLRDQDGRTTICDLWALGVTPLSASSAWHSANFVIDARKRHLLPAPIPVSFIDYFSDFGEPEEEEEGEWD